LAEELVKLEKKRILEGQEFYGSVTLNDWDFFLKEYQKSNIAEIMGLVWENLSHSFYNSYYKFPIYILNQIRDLCLQIKTKFPVEFSIVSKSSCYNPSDRFNGGKFIITIDNMRRHEWLILRDFIEQNLKKIDPYILTRLNERPHKFEYKFTIYLYRKQAETGQIREFNKKYNDRLLGIIIKKYKMEPGIKLCIESFYKKKSEKSEKS
jgi:hypothetical protein